VRSIDDAAIARAGAIRRRSESDSTLFEYLRSAKIIQSIERTGVPVRGRILDAGCGPGGTALSLAEEASFVVGLDLDARFRNAGTRLAD
jgi:2-polyprenyl-3-methyl-5-hydroxy-6-metoxy-1,4-benzoquinol methylase